LRAIQIIALKLACQSNITTRTRYGPATLLHEISPAPQ